MVELIANSPTLGYSSPITTLAAPIQDRISRAVIERDGGVCHICGREGADTADHLVPRSVGGDSTDTSLLAAAHRGCNSRRGARAHSQPQPEVSR
jgi:5-methylcytosine-specific restriction endonuclease McrA